MLARDSRHAWTPALFGELGVRLCWAPDSRHAWTPTLFGAPLTGRVRLCSGVSFWAYSQRLKDITRGYPLPKAQEGLTLSPKGRPTTGNFLTPSAPLPCPYLRHPATVCLGEISKNQRQQLTKFADIISRDSKAFTFRESCTSGSWQIPSSSASHQALREDEAQGSWLPLLPGGKSSSRKTPCPSWMRKAVGLDPSGWPELRRTDRPAVTVPRNRCCGQ